MEVSKDNEINSEIKKERKSEFAVGYEEGFKIGYEAGKKDIIIKEIKKEIGEDKNEQLQTGQ